MSTTSAHGSEGPVAELGKVAGEHRPRSPGTWEAGLTRGPSLKLNTDTHTQQGRISRCGGTNELDQAGGQRAGQACARSLAVAGVTAATNRS